MSEQETVITGAESPKGKRRRRTVRRISVILLLAVAAVFLIGWALVYGYNNVSLMDDETFARRLESAIENGRDWVEQYQDEILNKKNIALIRMLQDADKMHSEPVYEQIVKTFMSRRLRPSCWKALIDPNWPVLPRDLNQTIEREYTDNKWILYTLAPEKAKITPEQMGLFDPDRWQGRQLTHQLWALIHLRERHGGDKKLDELIEHLCDRIGGSLRFDVAVVDMYIQKVAFVLKAGLPEKINRRWIERIITDQRSDGGWNDKWFVFTSRRRPSLSPRQPPSDQHPTAQALWLLYQVKYRYPEEFGLAEQPAGDRRKMPGGTIWKP